MKTHGADLLAEGVQCDSRGQTQLLNDHLEKAFEAQPDRRDLLTLDPLLLLLTISVAMSLPGNRLLHFADHLLQHPPTQVKCKRDLKGTGTGAGLSALSHAKPDFGGRNPFGQRQPISLLFRGQWREAMFGPAGRKQDGPWICLSLELNHLLSPIWRSVVLFLWALKTRQENPARLATPGLFFGEG